MRPHSSSVPFYIAGGGVATLTHYALALALAEIAGVRPLAATSAGFAAGAAVKYWINYKVAFRSSARHQAALSRFLMLLAIMWALNAAVFFLLADLLGVHYMLAQVLTTGVLILPGYLLSRHWVFG